MSRITVTTDPVFGSFDDLDDADRFNAHLDDRERLMAEAEAAYTAQEAAAIAADRAFRIQTVKSIFSALRRLRVRAVQWGVSTAAVPCFILDGRFNSVELCTDPVGDGLYLATADGSLSYPLLATRDFSLNQYDLATTTGRRQARAYAHRKLAKLCA